MGPTSKGTARAFRQELAKRYNFQRVPFSETGGWRKRPSHPDGGKQGQMHRLLSRENLMRMHL